MNVQRPLELLRLRARQFLNRATLRNDITASLVLGIEWAPSNPLVAKLGCAVLATTARVWYSTGS